MGADRNFIERLTWDDVGRRIAGGSAAILPIGAAAKQHGFHLPLNADRIQAEYFAARLTERVDALVWPTVTYGYYPAFVEYAGSSSDVRSHGARDCRWHPRPRHPQIVRAQYRNQHAGAGRARAGAPRPLQGDASAGLPGPALWPRGRAAGQTKPRQPCR